MLNPQAHQKFVEALKKMREAEKLLEAVRAELGLEAVDMPEIADLRRARLAAEITAEDL